MNKYFVRFFASAEEYNTDKCSKKCSTCQEVYEAYLDFKFDTLDEALQFTKLAEKHIVENPIKTGDWCGAYYEEALEEVKWEISMRVISDNEEVEV